MTDPGTLFSTASGREPDLLEQDAVRRHRRTAPLAERMRPGHLDLFLGQDAAVGPESPVRRSLESGRLFSMIFWGPPGCGKTTLAGIIAATADAHFLSLSAVLSGVKEIRAAIETARKNRLRDERKTVVFVDEIHRFHKGQQDAFLPHVESGLITLIGATTENPSFEIISPLLSRCRVVRLAPLSRTALEGLVRRALTDTENGLGRAGLTFSDESMALITAMADGDGRSVLNMLDAAAEMAAAEGNTEIDAELLRRSAERRAPRYDKSGDGHYDLISAFHKSMRGSDPDASLYWLARMLEAGEDPLYIARRMVRFASEDVGNADPFALRIALDAVDSFRFLGAPEGELALAQAAVYLAAALKSNAVYTAWKTVRREAKERGSLEVPLHLRNAPTRLMKESGYGKGYRYAHDYPGGIVAQRHLPEELDGSCWYDPTDRGYEAEIRRRLADWRRLR